MSQTRGSKTHIETDSVVSSTESPNTGALSRDQIFELLSNQRRRNVLHFLKQQEGGKTELQELSTQVASWENSKSVNQLTSSERKRVYTSLQQFHLPKLHRNGVIEYDDQRGFIELTAAADNLGVYIDVVADQDVPWSLYYAGLSGLSFALVAAIWGGIYPFTLFPNLAWTAFIVTVFTVSALAHVYYDHRIRLGVDGVPLTLRDR